MKCPPAKYFPHTGPETLSPGSLKILSLSVLGALTVMSATVVPLQALADTTITNTQFNYAVFANTNFVIAPTGVVNGTVSNNALTVYAGVGSLINNGTINAVDGSAIESGSTIGTLTNNSQITGTRGISNGGTITALVNAVGATLTSNSQTIYNFGQIGSIANAGTINAFFADIYNANGTIGSITNSGTLTSSNFGLSNSGAITSFTNSGTIDAAEGILLGPAGTPTLGTLNNSGLVMGSTYALSVATGATLGNFLNTGTIAGAILNASPHDLVISGGSGAVFGTLTGASAGLGSADVGLITNTASNLVFSGGNQLLNDAVNVGGHTVRNMAGVLQVNNRINITGNYQQDAAATLALGVSSGSVATGVIAADSGYGRLLVSGTASIDSGSTIALKPLSTYNFAQGQRFVVLQAASGNYNQASLNYVVPGYAGAVVGTQVADGANSDLVVTLAAPGTPTIPLVPVTPVSPAGPATPSGPSAVVVTTPVATPSTAPINTATTGNAISSLGGLFKYAGVDAGLLAVFNPAAALGTSPAANVAGAQLSPAAVSSAAARVATSTSQAVFNVAASRLDGLRTAQAGPGTASGIATGESGNGAAVWGQGFGGQANQSERNDIAGYTARFNGLLVGTDSQVNERWRVGGLLNYANTSVNNEGDNSGSSVHVDGYGATAYGSYTSERWYLNMLAGATRQAYKTTRAIAFNGFAGVANGRFDGLQANTALQFGMPMDFGAVLPGSTLTAIAGLAYSRLRQDGYTESGGNGAGLTVAAANSNSLKSELAVKLEKPWATSYGSLVPSLQLGWRHEYRDTSLQSSASFTADSTGGSSFTTRGPAGIDDTGVVALGLTLLKSQNLSLAARYTLEGVRGYTSQTGDVQVRWQF